MLILKMMSDEDHIPDNRTDKGFVLAQVSEKEIVRFRRDNEGRAIVCIDDRIEWCPRGNTYVLNGDKVIAEFYRGLTPSPK